MGSLVLFFGSSDFILGLKDTLGASNMFAFVVALVGTNGIIEAVAATVVGTALSRILDLLLHRSKVRNTQM
jgi:hypothetical protein